LKAHVAEFGFAEAEIAKSKCHVDVRVELCEEPGGVPVGGEELHHGFEVQHLVLTVDGGALSASVLEEFLALGGSNNNTRLQAARRAAPVTVGLHRRERCTLPDGHSH
jgi:hypothetical protein